MKKIKTKNISWKKIEEGVNILEKKLLPLRATIKNIYGIPRGGLVPAVILSHRLNIPLVIDQRSISKNTVIVDEIIDSGKTAQKLYKKKKVKLFVSLFLRKGSVFNPDYSAFKINEKDFLVFPWESLRSEDLDKYIKNYNK